MTPRVLPPVLFAAAALGFALLPGPSAAAFPPLPKLTKDGGPAKPPEPSWHVITLTVTPAAAPVPALRYELLPALRDRVPGNAATDYRRAALLRPQWPRDPQQSEQHHARIDRWMSGPVDRLPVADVRTYLAGFSGTFRALDYAARCDRCDWELTHHLSVRDIDMLLPEVQQYREVTRANQLRVRADLAGNDFRAAADHLRAGFRLGKDVGEGQTLIQMLVGIAITAVCQGEVDQWIGRPGAPNLYWALATLPHPFIDPRHALEGESRFVGNLFPTAKELENGLVAPETANRVLDEMLTALRTMGGAEGPPTGLEAVVGKLGAAAFAAGLYPEAKRELPGLGYPAAEVEKMPQTQAVALWVLTRYRAMTDDVAKCFSLPQPRAAAELAKLRDRVLELKGRAPDPISATLHLTIPAYEKVYSAHARTGRRFAAQRAVEAVRLHAAANGGRPPAALADVTAVPVPDDPATGKPFLYAADGDRFTLTAPPPAKEPPHAGNSFRYEVTVRGN